MSFFSFLTSESSTHLLKVKLVFAYQEETRNSFSEKAQKLQLKRTEPAASFQSKSTTFYLHILEIFGGPSDQAAPYLWLWIAKVSPH